jgi:hypothetical protein
VSRPSEVELATLMRAAYNEHIDPGSKVTDFDVADLDKREAWLVCARAALVRIYGPAVSS